VFFEKESQGCVRRSCANGIDSDTIDSDGGDDTERGLIMERELSKDGKRSEQESRRRTRGGLLQ